MSGAQHFARTLLLIASLSLTGVGLTGCGDGIDIFDDDDATDDTTPDVDDDDASDDDDDASDDDDDNDASDDDDDDADASCEPGTTVCVDEFRTAECGEDGSPGTPESCPADAICADGACREITPTFAYCEACEADAECLDDGICEQVGAGFVCLTPCETKDDCEEGAACQPFAAGNGAFAGNFCVPESGDCAVAAKAGVGKPCEADVDCVSGICLQISETEAVCTIDCDGDRQCPTGLSCVPSREDSDGDDVFDQFVGSCTNLATSGEPLGATCQPYDGLDVPRVDCDTYLCVEGLAYDECTFSCDEGDLDCVNDCVDSGLADGDFRCSTTCIDDNDCPDDMVCAQAFLPLFDDVSEDEQEFAPALVCRKPFEVTCRITNAGNEVCDDQDNDCDGETDEGGVCAAADSTEVITLELGDVPLFGTGQVSKDFTVDVPKNAISMTIILKGLGASYGAVAFVRNPAGQELSDKLKPYAFDDTVAVQIPQSPAITLTPGKWRFSVVNWQQSVTAQVSVQIKTGTLKPQHTLKMNLFFVGTDVKKANAATNSGFQKVVAEVKRVYAQGGIDLDTSDVNYIDITGADATKYANIDSTDGVDSELRQLFALSSRAPTNDPRRVNVFFVKTISSGQAGFITLGISGGIPGPPGVQGTRSSGVVVGLDSYGAGSLERKATDIASTWAHEMGHFMGLFHTTERDGKNFDPLPDTAECPASRDVNFDGYLLPDECRNNGADNLMFWAADPDAEKVSAQQGEVIRRNSLSR